MSDLRDKMPWWINEIDDLIHDGMGVPRYGKPQNPPKEHGNSAPDCQPTDSDKKDKKD